MGIKENYALIHLGDTEAKILNRILAIQKYTKRTSIQNQGGFIAGMQGCFNTKNQILQFIALTV